MSLNDQNIVCHKCKKDIKSRDFLKCAICTMTYDIDCVIVSYKRFSLMRQETKLSWECPSCRILPRQKKTNKMKSVLATCQKNVLTDTKSRLEDITPRKTKNTHRQSLGTQTSPLKVLPLELKGSEPDSDTHNAEQTQQPSTNTITQKVQKDSSPVTEKSACKSSPGLQASSISECEPQEVLECTAWGYIESFLFWLLQDLGASRSLMGITITVGGVAGLPLLVLSGPIIRRLGHANVLFIGFVFYAIRLLGYSLIYNPWLCLVFEALESVTSSLSFTAAVTYAARLSSTTTDTSVQGLLGGLYYGVGKGAGSLIGGYLMKFFGTRPTYQIFACATFITGCMYYLFNKFYIGKRAMGDENDIYKKKPAIADVEGHDSNNVDADKGKLTIDGVIKPEINKLESAAIDKVNVLESNQKAKLVADNTDGGSDSGVENPAYTDTENSNNAKKITDEKTCG